MMKKNTLLLIAFCVSAIVSQAQVENNSRFLNQASLDFRIKFDANYARAMTLAKKYNWPLSYTTQKGQLVQLVGVDAFDQPKYYITTNNTIAAATTRANQLWPGGSTGLNLTGSSSNMKNKLGVWDGGAVLASHVELGTDRVTQRDTPSSTIDHATHVSGTMIAKGVNASAKGMAYGATGLVAYDFTNDVPEMFREAGNGILMSNHSYSFLAGWVQNEAQNNRWEFYGEPNATEDYKFGYYSSDAQVLDSLAYNAPFYLIVKSAGNNRDENGPAVGSPYFRRNAQGQMVASGNRPDGISSNDGYDIITMDCGAKNILTVGAVNGIAAGYSRKEDVVMSSFSSWGPTDDGRIKPDIVADGVNVFSPIATSTSSYASYSGTSMAAPNATGSLFLLQEYYSKLKNSATAFLRSATLRGLAIHTANEAGLSRGPDYQYGWGLLNVEKAAAVMTAAVPSNNAATSAHQLYENSLNQGQTFTTTVVASGKGPLTATICWTDPKGSVAPLANALNNRAKNLVNDLDVRITRGSGATLKTYMPWTLDVNNPASAAVPGDNITDNVERIDIDSTIPGMTYTITVTHKGTLARGSQAYSLLVSGVGGIAYCASAPTSNTGTRIDSVVFKNIALANPAGNTTYTDYTNYIADVEPGQTSTIRVKVGSSDATTASKMVKVFIDYDNNGTFDASELATSSSTALSNGSVFIGSITTPSNLVVGNLYRMRIIAQETTNASDIVACGSYSKGETEDFVVRVVDPSNDMSVTAVVSPQSGSCGYSTAQYVTISLRNNGANSQSNIPVSLSVANSSGTVIANVTGVYPGTITSLKTVLYTFQTPVILTGGGVYTITATSSLTGDQFSANNQLTVNVTMDPKPVVSGIGGICNTTAILKVVNPGVANYFWYSSATDQNPFGTGPSTSTTTIPADKTYYLGEEARISVGPANKLVYPSGGYNNFVGNYVKFNNAVPVIIESARLYIGNPGTLKITAGTITSQTETSFTYRRLATTTLNVYATNPNPQPAPCCDANGNPTGVPGNPTTDTGAVYALFLPILETGDHVLIFECDAGGATIFRNNSITTTNTYPMGPTNIFSLTGNSATNQESQFYYFMYDIKVNTIDCPSDRVAVVASTITAPTISQVADSLVSSAATGNQWYLNDTAINGASGQKYKPTKAGAYKVTVTDQFGCQKVSNIINYVLTAINPVSDGREINLKVSPNPSKGIFNLSFEVTSKADLSIDMYNETGQRIYNNSQSNFSGKYSRQLNLPNAASGVYMLKVQHDKKTYVVKVVVQR